MSHRGALHLHSYLSQEVIVLHLGQVQKHLINGMGPRVPIVGGLEKRVSGVPKRVKNDPPRDPPKKALFDPPLIKDRFFAFLTQKKVALNGLRPPGTPILRVFWPKSTFLGVPGTPPKRVIFDPFLTPFLTFWGHSGGSGLSLWRCHLRHTLQKKVRERVEPANTSADRRFVIKSE